MTFFYESDGVVKKLMSTPEIHEYMVYNFLWQKFGISAYETAKLDAQWVQKMLTIEGAKSRAESAQLRALEKDRRYG